MLTFPYPSVSSSFHRYITVILTVYLVIFPVIMYFPVLKEQNKRTGLILRVTVVLVLFLSTGFMLVRRYNSDVERVINMERLVFDERWGEAVDYYEENPSRNLLGLYFYNVSLSETGQLCDRMFSVGQGSGVKSLFLPWDDEHLNWGAHVFYAAGHINEAHRWAYE